MIQIFSIYIQTFVDPVQFTEYIYQYCCEELGSPCCTPLVIGNSRIIIYFDISLTALYILVKVCTYESQCHGYFEFFGAAHYSSQCLIEIHCTETTPKASLLARLSGAQCSFYSVVDDFPKYIIYNRKGLISLVLAVIFSTFLLALFQWSGIHLV